MDDAEKQADDLLCGFRYISSQGAWERRLKELTPAIAAALREKDAEIERLRGAFKVLLVLGFSLSGERSLQVREECARLVESHEVVHAGMTFEIAAQIRKLEIK